MSESLEDSGQSIAYHEPKGRYEIIYQKETKGREPDGMWLEFKCWSVAKKALYSLSLSSVSREDNKFPGRKQEGLQSRKDLHLASRRPQWESPSHHIAAAEWLSPSSPPSRILSIQHFSETAPPHPQSSTEVVERGMTDGRGHVVRVELAEMDADMGQGVKGAETRLEGIAYLSICWAFCLRGQYNM